MKKRVRQVSAHLNGGSTITRFGISTALLTPFQDNGRISLAMLSGHANAVLAEGADGVTLFGTTGEGASVGLPERADAIAAMINSGIAARQITLGLCASAVSDVLAQMHQGLSAGIETFLLLPPFYFKDPDDQGLFDWHARLFREADSRARFILYHIPQVSYVPLSIDLVMRLHRCFPDRVLAIKDSAGRWDNTKALLDSGEIPVLVGDERLLHKAAAMGAVGSICGMANLYPRRLQRVFGSHVEDSALSRDVDLIVSVPVIPALKQIMATMTGNGDWDILRPPLQPLQDTQRAAIDARFAGFTAA